MIHRIAVLINTKDRATELALLLQSLRTQTCKEFDIFILDDQSNTDLNSYHFIKCIFNRLIQENHLIFYKKTEFPHGVSRARQAIVDWALDQGDYEYLCRVDDDVVLEHDYLYRLKEVISRGYDLATGVTVPMIAPTFKRDPKYLRGVANRIVLDMEGNYIWNGDDCGIEYIDSHIIPAHHFRSCALYKSEIHKKVNYWPTTLSMHGFREEQIFSYKLLMAGYKIGCDTRAINYHQLTPSGGERPYTDKIQFNQEQFEKFTKEHKDELKQIFDKDRIEFTEEELKKETNLAKLK